MTHEQKQLFHELRQPANTSALVERIKLWFQIFPELTAPQVHSLDVRHFGSSNPEKSYRARISELSGPKHRFFLEMSAKTRTGQYGKPEHYYKLRKL